MSLLEKSIPIWLSGRKESRSLRAFFSKKTIKQLHFIVGALKNRTKFTAVIVPKNGNNPPFLVLTIVRDANRKRIRGARMLHKDGNTDHYMLTIPLQGRVLINSWIKSEFKGMYFPDNDTIKIPLPPYFATKSVIPYVKYQKKKSNDDKSKTEDTKTTTDSTKDRRLIDMIRLEFDMREAEAITFLQGMSDASKKILIARLNAKGKSA